MFRSVLFATWPQRQHIVGTIEGLIEKDMYSKM